MADRKKTPDLMDELLGGPGAGKPGEQPADQPAEKPAGKVAEQQGGKPERPPARKTGRQSTSKPGRQQVSRQASQPASEEGKIKATYYLSQETLDRLDEALLKVRRLASRDKRREISRSSLVETALLLALDELEEEGAESQLASRMVEQ